MHVRLSINSKISGGGPPDPPLSGEGWGYGGGEEEQGEGEGVWGRGSERRGLGKGR
jgi:hypothetical protein